ncbi:MAG: hypothetical protein AAF725_03900 [Acidobacteriota bacterium]
MKTDTRTSLANRPEEAYKRFFLTALATASCLALVGYLPTRELAGEAAVSSMLAAICAAFAGSAAGTLPVFMARHLTPLEAMPAQLGAMLVRLVVTLFLGLALALSGLVMVKPFMVWLVLGHTGFLVADVLFARAMVNTAAAAEGSVGSDRATSPALPQP